MDRGEYFWSFGGFVQKNKPGVESLQNLSLDLIDCIKADHAWYEHEKATRGGFPYRPVNFFAEIVLGILPEEPEQNEDDEDHKSKAILFKSLKTLSLSAVPFVEAEIEMIYAFNIGNLTTLKLINCHACLGVLDHLVQMNQGSTLKSFELVIDTICLGSNNMGPEEQVKSIHTFLDSFSGLEDIFLMLWASWNPIFRAILNHATTLKRLVIHERGHDEDASTDDNLDGEIPWTREVSELISKTTLTCLGTTIPLLQLVRLYSLSIFLWKFKSYWYRLTCSILY
jgi:hypothetical protein